VPDGCGDVVDVGGGGAYGGLHPVGDPYGRRVMGESDEQ